MKKYLPSLVCGFGAGVLLVVPLIKVFNCCLIIPGAAILSIVLNQKATGSNSKVTLQDGILFGLFTGLFAAFFGTFFETIITYATKSNDLTEGFYQMKEFWGQFQDDAAVEGVMQIFEAIKNDIELNGFSLEYSFFLLISNLVTGTIFGMLGGLLGMKITNTGIEKNQNF